MKSMHIAASCELVTRLSTHRRVVALDSTDFTDVAAVVISVADSRSGILTLLRRSGFNLPVYLLSETAVDKPEGVQAVIAGKIRSGWSWRRRPVIMKRVYCRRFSIP